VLFALPALTLNQTPTKPLQPIASIHGWRESHPSGLNGYYKKMWTRDGCACTLEQLKHA
jgi:hypothetical protein